MLSCIGMGELAVEPGQDTFEDRRELLGKSQVGQILVIAFGLHVQQLAHTFMCHTHCSKAREVVS